MQKVALGFFGVIFLGGVLLWLPACNQKPIAFFDSLFTSVSAVCVTGLVTVIPAEQFTLLGKIILMLLIQIGGLGVIACTMAFFLALRRKITMKDRVMIQQAYGLDTLTGLVRFVIRILKGTLLVEGIGAILFSIKFVPEYGLYRGIGYGIFHAISAFCNAGIDILGNNSFIDYASSPLINFTTMFLIVMGGLGFPVWHNIRVNTQKVWRGKEPKARLWSRLGLQSKIVLTMTAALILLGTVGFFLLEYNNPETMKEFSAGQKLMASAFQSVTTRTAGFAAVPQSELTEGSRLLGCILMFIGGSPGSTAGGIKTTTMFIMILSIWSEFRKRKDIECFRRRMEENALRHASCVTMLYGLLILVGTVLISSADGVMIQDALFEAASAIGTVGLSLGITAQLGTVSHIVLILLMFIGRVGGITILIAFGNRIACIPSKLPMEKVSVG